MNIIDLTHPITEDMPVYPGTGQPEITAAATIEHDGYLEHRVSLFTHTGTHVDAPAHLIKGAPTLDEMSIAAFCGPAAVIDCSREPEEALDIDRLAPYEEEIAESDFLLLNSGWYRYWGREEYFRDYPSLTPEAASWLAGFDLRGIGVDTISVDPAGSEDFPVHNILMEKGILIIENLTGLHRLPRTSFIFSCFPLRLQNADGSPVRAVAFTA